MRTSLTTTLALCALVSVSAQEPQSTQRPATFRADARLVRVSVVVHDRDGQPVSGLTAEDFDLREDGQQQRVALFSVEGSVARTAAALAQPNVFTNRIDSPSSSGVTVLLFDRLNTRDEHQALARKHVIQYLKQLRPDARVGLYVLDSDYLRVLHDFSRDATSLLKALDRAVTPTSKELSGSEDKLPDLEPTGVESLDALLRGFVLDGERQLQGFYTERRIKSTTGAMEDLARHLAGVRGRKNVIWISSGFPIRFDSGVGSSGFLSTSSREIYKATRALNNADIAFYPVDARGLIGAFSTPASAREQRFTTLDGVMRNVESSQVIAEHTGGRAFFNTNDLGGAIARAAEDSRLTYVLGYYPSNDKWDGRFREIKVRVQRRAVDVRHRKGYFALPPVPPSAEHRKDTIFDALRSPLDATGLGLSVSFQKTAVIDEVTLTIRVEPDSVSLHRDGAEWVGELDIAIAQALPDGRLFNSLDTTIPLGLANDVRDRMLIEGLTLTRTVSVRSDAHQIKVALRNTAGAIGTVTIPASRLRAASTPQPRH